MKKVFFFAIMLLYCFILVYGDVSYSEASSIILNQITNDEVGRVNVFLSKLTICGNVSVSGMGHTLLSPYLNNWVGFVDEQPICSWTHACRYIFINSNSGQYQVIHDKYPLNNTSLYNKVSSINFSVNTTIVPPSNETETRPTDNNLYAVLINATEPDLNNSHWLRFWNEISAMYCTLVYEYGCPKSHISVLSADATASNNFQFSFGNTNYRGLDLDFNNDQGNTNSEDIQYACNSSNLSLVFSALGNQISPIDKVVVFLTGHGEYDGNNGFTFRTWNHEYVNSSTFDTLLDNLNNCKQVVVVATPCQSGGYINGANSIVGHNRSIVTSVDYNQFNATAENEPAEMFLTPVPSDPDSSTESVTSGYGEFAYYFISAIRGHYPQRELYDPDHSSSLINQPWGNGTDVGLNSFQSSFWSNHPQDIPFSELKENPAMLHPLLFRSYQYADIWDTVSEQALLEEGLNQYPNYYNPKYPEIPEEYRTHPQYYSNGCLYRDRQTLADVDFNLAGYNVRDQLTFDNRALSLNGSLNISGCLKLINNSIFNIANGSTLNLVGGTYQSINSSSYLSGNVSLFSAGLISLEDNSIFTCNPGSAINGSTNAGWVDPNTNIRYDTFDEAMQHFNAGAKHYSPGDRIIVDHSGFKALGTLEDPVIINCPGNNRWDGLYFTGYGDFPAFSHFEHCLLTKIQNFEVTESYVEVYNSEISYSGQLKILDNSWFPYSNIDYHHNDCCIYVERSHFADRGEGGYSSIHNNLSTGISFNYIGNDSSLDCVNIYDNAGNGVEIHNCHVKLSDSNIYNNEGYGYLSLSGILNRISQSSIYNNENAELIVLRQTFPYFGPEGDLLYSHSDINDSQIGQVSGDQYLMVAVGPPEYVNNEPQLIRAFGIDTDNVSDWNTRLIPDRDQWLFSNSQGETGLSERMFRNAMACIDQKLYVEAIDTLKTIIDQYPESEYSKHAVCLLPYLYKTIEGDLDALRVYFTEIDNENLEFEKYKAEITLDISEELFNEAISKLEMIINNPPDNTEKLLAEIDEAYCYYKLVTEGNKSLPLQCTYKPTSFQEYSDIKDMNYDLIISEGGGNNPGNPSPVFNTYAVNYPNPFNNSTKISYTLSQDTICRIDVYNVKGQKVKTLISCNKPAGKHSVTWNGSDDKGVQVSSGVYFYKITTPERSLTRKMIMLK